MSRQEYYAYLQGIMDELFKYWPGGSTDLRAIIFKLTASPYHFWQEPSYQDYLEHIKGTSQDRAVFSPEEERITRDIHAESAQSSPKASVEPPPADASNLANKAQEIREKARTSIKEYMRTRESTMSSEALTALRNLANDWGKGMTVYKALDLIPDKELCLWNEKHEVFM